MDVELQAKYSQKKKRILNLTLMKTLNLAPLIKIPMKTPNLVPLIKIPMKTLNLALQIKNIRTLDLKLIK